MVKRVSAARELIGIQSEDSFEVQVMRLARLYGWHGFHVRHSQASTRGVHTLARDGHMDGFGWPDWVFVRDRILFRELKTEVGRQTRHQKQWAAVLSAAGADVAVWTPGMLDQITREFATSVAGFKEGPYENERELPRRRRRLASQLPGVRRALRGADRPA